MVFGVFFDLKGALLSYKLSLVFRFRICGGEVIKLAFQVFEASFNLQHVKYHIYEKNKSSHHAMILARRHTSLRSASFFLYSKIASSLSESTVILL